MEAAIKTTDLRKQFGKTEVLKGLDLTVPTGSVYGLLGRNGAGKTTTIQILMDAIRATSGQALVLGSDPHVGSVSIRTRIGYVSENHGLFEWMRVREIVAYSAGLRINWDAQEAERLMDGFGLDREARIGSLSRGQAAQVALVCALGHHPELLILDEPASGLDLLVRRDFLDSIIGLIQEEGRTVLVSSHLVHEVERIADRVGILDGGRLIESGETDSVKNSVVEITLRMIGSELPDSNNLRILDRESDHVRAIAYDFTPSRLAALKTNNEILEVKHLSLEDAFVAHINREERS